ncbi:hypothetical protein AGRA3207_006203 [Actinomadura graeca]|uniref:Uncharacterized protein n=1 Tax=Actinomadura graeca TaxID=2750812 RepID=A0ABX8R136_9ACTN|nr:hypothetical protein [Actinomadura graeca]QXJ24805.1 hypothetical protein AGRA3207_006203 [Actinomadura graeca]
MSPDSTISVLRDVLRVYDHRYLDLDLHQRERLVEGTRRVIGEEGLSDAARAALPASVRLRAFCIQHGLREELERLIRDEAEGAPGGAVVVGGRIYALYPYLRGVSRQDADITTEVGVDHRLDAVGWQGGRLRIRGTAALQRVETPRTDAELILRNRASGGERRFPAESREAGFEVFADPAVLGPGRWEAHVAVTALGVTREAPFGAIRAPRFKAAPQRRTLGAAKSATADFTKEGHLAVQIDTGNPHRESLLRRLFS